MLFWFCFFGGFFPVVKAILCKIAFELNYSLILGQQPVFTFQLSQLKIWETDQPSIPLLPYIIWCFGNDDEDNLDILWMNQQIHKLKALLAICSGVFSLPCSKHCAHKLEMLVLFKKRRTKKREKNPSLFFPLKKSLPELLAEFPQKAWTPSKLGIKFRPQLGEVEYFVQFTQFSPYNVLQKSLSVNTQVLTFKCDGLGFLPIIILIIIMN